MSFSRAPLKRFNEYAGCAPAPGSYEIKPGELRGVASFDKSDRFRPVKAGAGQTLLPPPSPSRSLLVSPVRRTLSVDGLVEGLSVKKEKNDMTLDKKQQKLLEKEIRSLVQQRGEQDRRLLTLEEELKKVEAKLLVAVREKTGLAANVTTLERQRAELKKINELLKNKVSADATKKRLNSLTMELLEARNNLDVKHKELSVLQITSEGQMKAIEADLLASRATVSALEERSKDLEDLHQVTKTQNEEFQNENARLHAVIQELNQEVRVVQGYLDTANDEIQDLRLKLEEMTQKNMISGSQLDTVKLLEAELEHCVTDLKSTEARLRQKEEEALNLQQELQASKDVLLETETRLENQKQELKSSQEAYIDLEKKMNVANQHVHDFQATVRQQEAELARLREVLRRTEKELDERVAHLEQRCLFSEEERCKTQEEGLRRVQELKTELTLLKEAKRDERKKQIQLQQEHAVLTEELTKEKALVDSLSVLVKQEREESEEKLKQLTEEMEEIMGELAMLEDQDEKRQEVLEKSHEAIQKLQEERDELEKQLRDMRAQLKSKDNDVAALQEENLAAMKELKEANMSSLSKLESIVTELESSRDAVKAAEEEVRRVTQQMKDETDKVIHQKEEEIKRMQGVLEEHQERQLAEAKARDENARLLLEVQTCLAHKDEELKAMEMSHTALISQLQQEMEMQKKEKEEEQRSQSIAQLQDEKEKAQNLLEEVRLEKEGIMEQLEQERGKRVGIERELEELRGTLETERKDLQQVESEVPRLNAELNRVNEENKRLLSQVELADESRLALENQLGLAEQERNELKTRLTEATQQGVNLHTEIDVMEEAMQSLQQQVNKQQQDKQALQRQVEILTQEKVTLQWELEEQQQEMQRQIADAQDKSLSSSETEQWRQLYEELFAKVKPFQEQLNAFAAEKNALLNENGANQEKLNKLADAYARLLGHQNQKQKIKHVMKLKDENISLKQEVSKLRSQMSRQKSDLEQLKSKLPGVPCRRFDPSKAFQHDKENRQAEAAEPLREGNHYA
ncbi:hyaluronan mediated motility receptor [Betta splendens]|uniref:Hyaluronan mediated motility receptor n=1 Tax=Betta splendens TaxID=158456 RepID=A0A6P7NS04_BETSP|nr:hyaluronan mediated motility receptor [Betta splendens]